MPDRIPAYCTLCRSRCGCTVVVEDGKLASVEPLLDHPTGGALCAKGRAAPELAASPRRLTKPLKRTSPRGARDPVWAEISWDEALSAIAAKLEEIRRLHGAEAVAFAVTTPSGTPMIDSFEWVERFIRLYGSPNLIYAVEVCGWHKDYAHALTFGRGIGMPDYEQADTIVLWGHNPVRTWLAQATRIADARQRGAQVIVVDPSQSGSGQQSDLWLRIRPGADGALAMGAIRHLIETAAFDEPFVTRWTNAPMLIHPRTGHLLRAGDIWTSPQKPEAFVVMDQGGAARAYDPVFALDHANEIVLRGSFDLTDATGRPLTCRTVFDLLAEAAAGYTPGMVAELTWLDPQSIERFNAAFAFSPKLAYHAWTGVGQHTNATATERAIATLYALTGACDRQGGNLWPVPPPTRAVNDYGLLAPAQQAKALGLDALPLGPPSRGWITARDFSRAVLDGEPYKVRALIAFGTNFVVSQGHSSRNRAALQALEFQVHADMFMNPAAECADIVLPVSMPWEREALKIGFEITQDAVETIQFRPKMIEPPGDCRADSEIVADLAKRLGFAEEFFGGSIEAGWNHQLEPLGLTVETLRASPYRVRCPQDFSERKFAAAGQVGAVAGFATQTRRVELYSEQMLRHGYDPLPSFVDHPDFEAAAGTGAYPLVLTTAKSGWFIHSSYRHVASLRRKSPEPSVSIHPSLAEARGVHAGDWVIVETRAGKSRLRARFDPVLDPRVAVAEFGWWEDCPPLGLSDRPDTGDNASNINNILTDDLRDPVSGSVPLRAVPGDIQADHAANVGSWMGRRDFRIAARHREAEGVVAIDLVPRDGGLLPNFRPGQHVVVTDVELGMSRAYSLTNAVAGEVLSIAVGRNDAGRAGTSLSQRLHAAGLGSIVSLEPPFGVFSPPLRTERPVVLLAAGIGITPFMSYLETLAACPAGWQPGRIVLLHVCRNGRQHPFKERLKTLRERIAGLRIVTFYSQPQGEDRPGRDFDAGGRLDPALVAPLVPDRPLAYVCGGAIFSRETAAHLAALGVPRFDIFAEAFVSPPDVPADLVPRRIQIANSSAAFTWTPARGTILDAALHAGIRLPSGCRAGQCESCHMRVAEGSVAHLTPFDGEGCLTCQAVPLTDLILAP